MRKNLSYLSLCMIIFALCAFTKSGNQKEDPIFDNGDKWIPADFDPRNGTLLVEKFILYNRKHEANKGTLEATEKMKEHMKKKYHYKYKFIDTDDWNDTAYNDTNEYRYVIMFDNSTKVSNPITSRGREPGSYKSVVTANGLSHTENNVPMAYSSNDFHIYDRKLDIHYPITRKSNSYALPVFIPFINTIVKFLKALK